MKPLRDSGVLTETWLKFNEGVSLKSGISPSVTTAWSCCVFQIYALLSFSEFKVGIWSAQQENRPTRSQLLSYLASSGYSL